MDGRSEVAGKDEVKEQNREPEGMPEKKEEPLEMWAGIGGRSEPARLKTRDIGDWLERRSCGSKRLRQGLMAKSKTTRAGENRV